MIVFPFFGKRADMQNPRAAAFKEGFALFSPGDG